MNGSYFTGCILEGGPAATCLHSKNKLKQSNTAANDRECMHVLEHHWGC